MGGIAKIFNPPKPPSMPAPTPAPAPVAAPVATVADAAGDSSTQKNIGGAARRRSSATILTDQSALLGATAGKTLLGS